MKTLVIDHPGAIALRDVPRPTPGPGEVLLRVEVVGFCGSDLNTFRGRNPLVAYPRVPGHEIGATIAGAGAGVPGSHAPGTPVTVVPYRSCGTCGACRRGRRNCCERYSVLGVQQDGVFAPYCCLPWAMVLPAPRLSARELALVEPLAVGFHAVARSRIAAGESLAVFGCGAVGLGAVAGGAARGARVIAIDIDDAKLAIARSAGAAEAVNSATEDLHARLVELTGGDGPDATIEAVGLAETFQRAVAEVGHAGRVVFLGWAKEPIAFQTKEFLLKELDIMGSRTAVAADFEAVVAHLEAGRFPVDAVVTRTAPLAEAPAAMQAWAAAPQDFTKIQIRLEDGDDVHQA